MSIDNLNTWAKKPNDFYMKIEHKKEGDEIVLKSRTGFEAIKTFFDCLFHKNDYRLSAIVQHVKNCPQGKIEERACQALKIKIDHYNSSFDKHPIICSLLHLSRIEFPFIQVANVQDKEKISKEFAKVNSAQLVAIDVNLQDREAFLKSTTRETSPPIVSKSEFVSDAMASHLMRNKKDSACGVKYQSGDVITNMEGAMHTFLTPVTTTTMVGDYVYRGYHDISHFDQGLGREVILSGAVQPDFELSGRDEVVMKLVEVKDQEVVGQKLAKEFTPLWQQVGHDKGEFKKRLPEYEKELQSHMVYNLTRDHKLPKRSDLQDNQIHTPENAVKLIEEQIKTPSDDLVGALKLSFVTLNGHVLSLEALFQLYIQQMENEFSVLEKMLPQGYIYTIDPPAIFATQIGGDRNVDLLNRLQILALVHLKQKGFSFENLKMIAFNDYKDKGASQLLQALFQDKTIVSKSELFKGEDGKFSCREPFALVLHNNSDAFGQNIETEGVGGSMDAAIGNCSDAACHLRRKREDLLAFVTTPEQIATSKIKNQDLLPKVNYLLPNVLMGAYPSDPNSDAKAEEMAKELLDVGVTHFVSLMEQREIDGKTGKNRFKQYRPVVEKLSPKAIAFENIQIPDVETIEDKEVEEFIQNKLLELAKNPTNKIYIHCHGGNGRTSLISTILLSRLHKISFEEAAERVFRASLTRKEPLRPYLPESEAQFEQMKRLCFKPTGSMSDLTYEAWRKRCKELCGQLRPDLEVHSEIVQDGYILQQGYLKQHQKVTPFQH